MNHMTNFLSKPQAGNIVKLSGKLTGYRCTRASANFVYSKSDQHKMGDVAITAALAGMGGQAASTAASAGDMEEPAEYLEFDLNGNPVKGWVWRSPFKVVYSGDGGQTWSGINKHDPLLKNIPPYWLEGIRRRSQPAQ
jgi:hypothetical protein